MAEMVLLKCDIGSRAATVLCPECGRISRQILLSPYNHEVDGRLIRPHICPICEASFDCCTSRQAENWLAAFERYNRNADDYNQTVKRNYSSKKAALLQNVTNVLSSAAQATQTMPTEKSYFYCSVQVILLYRLVGETTGDSI